MRVILSILLGAFAVSATPTTALSQATFWANAKLPGAHISYQKPTPEYFEFIRMTICLPSPDPEGCKSKARDVEKEWLSFETMIKNDALFGAQFRADSSLLQRSGYIDRLRVLNEMTEHLRSGNAVSSR